MSRNGARCGRIDSITSWPNGAAGSACCTARVYSRDPALLGGGLKTPRCDCPPRPRRRPARRDRATPANAHHAALRRVCRTDVPFTRTVRASGLADAEADGRPGRNAPRAAVVSDTNGTANDVRADRVGRLDDRGVGPVPDRPASHAPSQLSRWAPGEEAEESGVATQRPSRRMRTRTVAAPSSENRSASRSAAAVSRSARRRPARLPRDRACGSRPAGRLRDLHAGRVRPVTHEPVAPVGERGAGSTECGSPGCVRTRSTRSRIGSRRVHDLTVRFRRGQAVRDRRRVRLAVPVRADRPPGRARPRSEPRRRDRSDPSEPVAGRAPPALSRPRVRPRRRRGRVPTPIDDRAGPGRRASQRSRAVRDGQAPGQ